MTPIRALFFLAAVTAACAGRIPVEVQETSSLETRIALLASQSLTGNPIGDAIERFKELVEKIKERIEQAEAELVDALQATTATVARKISEFILKKTGVDLKLEERLEALEKKTEECNSQFKLSLKDIVLEIKTSTETCAATQVADVKEISKKIITLVQLLEVVPVKTISGIKACVAAPTTVAPPTTEAPDTEAPATEAPATEAPETEAPETEAPATESPATEGPADDDSTDSDDSAVALRGAHAVRSWSDAWRKAKCVTKVLAVATKELAEVPEILEKIYSDIADLSNKAARQALEKCAEQAVAGKAPLVQEAVAQLAYCVIAPSKQ